MKHAFDIEEYGAVADGATLNTTAIQRAIDACHDAGGGRVVCGPGAFRTGTITLKSNVDLHLVHGARLVGSTSDEDYEDLVAPGFIKEHAPEKSAKCLFRAVDAENISITGAGEINGSGVAFYDPEVGAHGFFKKPARERPRIVMMYRCRDVRFEDASFVDSPGWTFWLMKCERVTVRGVKVRGDQRMINNDGLDLDACRDVTVADSIFRTGDDCIILRSIRSVFDEPGVCENVTVSNCTLDSRCQGVRVGCPGDGVIRNCTFSNLVINSTNNGIVFHNPQRYVPADGLTTADISGISFSNVVMTCAKTPIQVLVEGGIELEGISDLSFADFTITSGRPIVVQGSPETTIRDVRLRNITIRTTGSDAVLCRFCDGVTFDGVSLSNRDESL